MSENSQNAGTRIVGNFTDQAVPLIDGQVNPDAPLKPGRSANTGVRVIADFRDQAQPLCDPKANGEKLKAIAIAFLTETMTPEEFCSASTTLNTLDRSALLDLIRRHIAETGKAMSAAQQQAAHRVANSLDGDTPFEKDNDGK
jgi:hypothetical protein